MKQGTARLGPNQRLTLAALKDGDMTRAQVMAHIRSDHKTRTNEMLDRLIERGLIHVCRWHKGHMWMKVYRLGPGENAPRPPAATRSELRREQHHRNRAAMGKLMGRIERARNRGASQYVVAGKVLWQRGAGHGKCFNHAAIAAIRDTL